MNIDYSSFMFVGTEKIQCPYCGEIQEEAYEYLPKNQEDWASYECEDCYKEFNMRYHKVYTTKRI